MPTCTIPTCRAVTLQAKADGSKRRRNFYFFLTAFSRVCRSGLKKAMQTAAHANYAKIPDLHLQNPKGFASLAYFAINNPDPLSTPFSRLLPIFLFERTCSC